MQPFSMRVLTRPVLRSRKCEGFPWEDQTAGLELTSLTWRTCLSSGATRAQTTTQTLHGEVVEVEAFLMVAEDTDMVLAMVGGVVTMVVGVG